MMDCGSLRLASRLRFGRCKIRASTAKANACLAFDWLADTGQAQYCLEQLCELR